MQSRQRPLGSVQQRWRVTGRLMVCGLWLGLATAAWGHVDLEPRQSIPKRWETYTLSVPTETDAPTVQIRLLVPPEFEVEAIEHKRAWQVATTRNARGFVNEVRWSGSHIPPQTFEAFQFLARNPAAVGTYRWSIEQVYQRGEPATWETQTQIISPQRAGIQRAEEAWRAAQVATTVSLVAIGIALMLIIMTVITIVQGRQSGDADA
ncbi:putative protein YcnI [Candidatus Entotheonellaceae bacterium PAL068K]